MREPTPKKLKMKNKLISPGEKLFSLLREGCKMPTIILKILEILKLKAKYIS